ncbi:hypothetical protein [Eoetvoesiella caeni]
MSKVLDQIRKLPWVGHVDDERESGSSIIVTLANDYDFADDPGCGVCGFENVKAALHGTRKSAVEKKNDTTPVIAVSVDALTAFADNHAARVAQAYRAHTGKDMDAGAAYAIAEAFAPLFFAAKAS